MGFSASGINNPFYGKKHSEEAKNKMRLARLGKKLSEETKRKLIESRLGKSHSEETKRKMSEAHRGEKHCFFGRHHTKETKDKIRMALVKDKSPLWKGGAKERNISLYDTYAPQISWCEEVRRDSEDEKMLNVKCTYCGKWYSPKRTNVLSRIASLNNRSHGENRFYCSDECKHLCPIFWQKSRYKFQEGEYTREVQAELRQIVFSRDNYKCVKCDNNKSLHCHHIEGIKWEPLISADVDMCVTLCRNCHKEVHKIDGCGYKDMRCI